MNYYYYYLVYISAYKELKVERLSLYNFKSDFYCAMLIPSNSLKFQIQLPKIIYFWPNHVSELQLKGN